jgi:hypothetical protein
MFALEDRRKALNKTQTALRGTRHSIAHRNEARKLKRRER